MFVAFFDDDLSASIANHFPFSFSRDLLPGGGAAAGLGIVVKDRY